MFFWMSHSFYVDLTLVNLGTAIFSSLENGLSPNLHFSSKKARSHSLCRSQASEVKIHIWMTWHIQVTLTRSENTIASLWNSCLKLIYLHRTTQVLAGREVGSDAKRERLFGALKIVHGVNRTFLPRRRPPVLSMNLAY